jgi:TolB-like protein/DNA-binding winged helix-turn-helix (wHTH) protein
MLAAEQDIFRFKDYRLDIGKGRLSGPEGEIVLRRKSFDLLVYLVRHAGRVVPKDELMEAIWPDVAVTDDSLTQCIHDIRQSLGPSGAELLRTVPRRGYLFAEAEAAQPSADPQQAPRPDWRRGAIAAILLIVLAGLAWTFLPAPPAATKASIAVLPFDNLSGDEATGRLASGITEDIITDLARFREFDVIARNSVEAYKGRPTDIREIGRALDVRFVLEGSIQRDGDRVRVTGQLIDTQTGAHVWSERWDRPVADVFDVQAELAQTVTGKLAGIAGTIVTADAQAARRKRPSDLSAYDLFVLASEAKQQETKESIARCFTLIDQALKIDPAFARAWIMLGTCHAFSMRWSDNWDKTHALYVAALRRAVELDPLDADAHAGLGMALALGGDLKQGEMEFDKAMSLNPNSADVLTRFAYWALTFKRTEEGAQAAERAVRLDPNARPWALRFQSAGLFYGGRLAEAIRVRQKIPKEMFIESDYIELASFLAAAQRVDEAKTLAKEALTLLPHISIEGWTGDPGWLEEDRQKAIALMRLAGFPDCASAAELAKGGIKVRLPECAP